MAESDKSADLANPDATVAGRTTHDRRRSAAFSDASNASDQATNQATKPLQKSKAHAGKGGEIFSVESFRRNWIWFLVGVLVFAAILLPIVLKVILPAVVQLIVNQQSLPILGGSFLFQGTNVILVSLNSSFQSPLPAAVNTFPLQLYNKESGGFLPWLKLQVPRLEVTKDTKFQIEEQLQQIVDGDEFSKWFSRFVDQDAVTVDVRGNGTTVKLGALESLPVLDKAIVIKGLNLRHGIRLDHLQLALPAVDGRNLRGRLMIPNTSPIVVGIGDYTLDLFAGDINFGYITIRDTILRPGENLQDFDGFADLGALATNLAPILKSQLQPLSEGKLEINVTGRECFINGQRLTHIESVLNHRTLIVRGSAAALLADLVGGIIAPQSNSSDSPYLGSALVNSVSTVFSNKTLLQNIANHWNGTTKTREKRMLPGTDELSHVLEKYII